MRSIRIAVAVVASVGASLAFVIPGAQAALAGSLGVQHYPCSSTRPPNLDGTAFREADYIAAGLTVSTGSNYQSCGRRGDLAKGDKLDYYCWTLGNDGYTYTYLSAYERGLVGWVQDRHLPGTGSLVHCPV